MEIVTYPQKEEIEMSIDKEHLSEMNRLLAHGKTIAEIADEYDNMSTGKSMAKLMITVFSEKSAKSPTT